jgi:RHS repeat-associated protein
VQAEVSVCTAVASVLYRQRVKAKPWRALRGLDPGTTAPGRPSLAAKKVGACTRVPTRVRGAECASTQKSSRSRERIFFISPQTRTAPSKNGLRYDNCASGRTFYNHWRSYDPATGRYTQHDPIGLAGGSFSGYDYVNSNPASLVDPDGLCPCGDVIDLVQLARGDKRDWSKAADRSDVNKAFTEGTYKCNLFADEQYENAGYYLPNVGGMPWNRGKYPPGARSLSDPKYELPGWPRVDGPAQPGDLVAHGGHVGIATSSKKTISASPAGKVENDWGSRPSQTGVVIRRCSCGR